MKTLPSVLFTLTFAVSSLLVQVLTPVPALPSFPVPSTSTQACGPIIDVVVGSSGLLLNTCDVGGVASARFNGSFRGGYVDAVIRNTGGDVVVLMNDGRIIKSLNGVVREWEVAQASAIISATGDTVTTVRQNAFSQTEYRLYEDGGVYSRKIMGDGVFPFTCTQTFEVKGDKYCLDRNNARIYRASAGFLSSARPANATPYLELEGLVFARPYKEGFLLLVRPLSVCPDEATKVPDSAVFCYFAGQCKEATPSQLLYVSGAKPNVQVLVTGLKVVFSSTFTVAGDNVYVVETDWDKNEEFQGDYVTKLNLLTGKKNSFLSREELSRQYGVESPSIWIN